MASGGRQWRCTVCGYIHEGDDPPDECLVCGAARCDFEPYTAPIPAAGTAKADRWQCRECNYIHEGTRPPDTCPVCGAGSDRFEPVALPALQPVNTGAGLRFVIIGAGIAGVSAAETIRKTLPESVITIVTREAHLPYYRLNLTRYLAHEINRDALPIHPAAWYTGNRIDCLTGRDVVQVDIATRTVTLDDGHILPYDRLVLATGSHPFIPPIPGTQLAGVHSLRTSDDAESMLAQAAPGNPCVCIGGGILGLETAGAIATSGAPVTLLESHGWLMPRQLNPAAAAYLERYLAGIGITVRKNARTAALAGRNHVEYVELQDGARLPARLVILATGVRPNTALARKMGLECNQGIVVNQFMQTSAPDVYACGDTAEHNGIVYGVWGASQFQGTIAGLNAAGAPTAFGGLPRSNSLKVLGLDMMSIGEFNPADGSYVVLDDTTDTTYAHYVFHDGRMTGCILVGNTEAASPIKKAMESNRSFTAWLNENLSARDISRRLAAGA